MTLDLAALKVHLGDDVTLSDDTLEMLLDAAREAVDDFVGPVGDAEAHARPSGPLLPLPRRALSIVSVVERDVVLNPLDYALRPSGSVLVRLDTGPSPSSRWSGRVDVIYVAVPDLAAREAAMVALVQLDASRQTPGLVSQRIGDWEESYASPADGEYLAARQEILVAIHGTWAGIR
jgi:hypothetical protein